MQRVSLLVNNERDEDLVGFLGGFETCLLLGALAVVPDLLHSARSEPNANKCSDCNRDETACQQRCDYGTCALVLEELVRCSDVNRPDAIPDWEEVPQDCPGADFAFFLHEA